MNIESLNFKERCHQVVERLSKVNLNKAEQDSIETLPPYNQYVAALHSRIKLQKKFYNSVIGLLLVVICVFQYDKHTLNQKLEHREVYFTPTHIPNILKLRANTLSDSLVFEFADFFLTQLGNVNYSMVDEKFKTLSKYMSPELRTRFMREMRPKSELWKMRKVDQELTHEPINRFERTSKGRETYFTVKSWTTIRKYVDGRIQPEEREQITLVFRTSPIDTEKSWLFEITDIVRKTPQELEDEQTIKEVENQ